MLLMPFKYVHPYIWYSKLDSTSIINSKAQIRLIHSDQNKVNAQIYNAYIGKYYLSTSTVFVFHVLVLVAKWFFISFTLEWNVEHIVPLCKWQVERKMMPKPFLICISTVALVKDCVCKQDMTIVFKVYFYWVYLVAEIGS